MRSCLLKFVLFILGIVFFPVSVPLLIAFFLFGNKKSVDKDSKI